MDSQDKESDCLFDQFILEERDVSSDTVIRSDKYCEAMPKSMTTTHAVVIK